MRIRWVLVAVTFAILATPLAAEAQQVGKVPRLGVLVGSPAVSWVEALRQGLRELGSVEGQAFRIGWRSEGGRYERFPELARELVRLKVDVLVAHPTIAVLAAKQATTTIPIVIPASADPVGAGLVASLARPGGNITGSTFISSEISGKRLEFLKAITPHAARVAVLANPTHPPTSLQLREAQVAAEGLGLVLEVLELRAAGARDPACSALNRGGAPAPLLLGHPRLPTGPPDNVNL